MNSKPTVDRAVIILTRQLDELRAFRKDRAAGEKFYAWERATRLALEQLFGASSTELKGFKDIPFSVRMGTVEMIEAGREAAFTRGLAEAEVFFQRLLEDIKAQREDAGRTDHRSAVALVERICRRFELVVRQIRRCRGPATVVPMTAEADVQDLLHALLVLHFDDVRAEESTPTCAGSFSKIDFLLKQEQIGIEVKRTRDGLAQKEITDQLHIDIGRYRQHRHCRTLICFVYDPEGRIKNPRGMEDDLNATNGEMAVRTVVTTV